LRWLAHRGHRPEIRGGARGQHEPLGTDPVRLLCAGSRGQTIARLAAHCRQRLVLADLPDAAVAAMLELDTTARRWRLPTSVGGVLTGRSAASPAGPRAGRYCACAPSCKLAEAARAPKDGTAGQYGDVSSKRCFAL
jgi:hypothetical protein